MKKLILFFSVAVLFALASCQKDNNGTYGPRSSGSRGTTNSSGSSQEICEDSIIDNWDMEDEPFPFKSSSSILNASDADQIPSQFFKIDPLYKLNYNFIVQPDPHSCGWTSYVTAVGAIARGNGYSYSSSSSKVYSVKSKCISITSHHSENEAKDITILKKFANIYDNQYVYGRLVCKKDNSSERFAAVKEMLNHINYYHTPFMVLSTFYYNDGRKAGHYLVVLSINWKQGGSGSTVYYTDCGYGSNGPDLDNNLRSMNFTTFLDRMVDSPNNYNMLFFQPN